MGPRMLPVNIHDRPRSKMYDKEEKVGWISNLTVLEKLE
jgi:hypothetical protein